MKNTKFDKIYTGGIGRDLTDIYYLPNSWKWWAVGVFVFGGVILFIKL